MNPPRRQGQPGRYDIVALLLTALAVEAVYVFVISAGHWHPWPFYLQYLDDLAEGFRQGHLHLAVEPPAALLARSNPFSPENRDLWYWDVSLYKGHYYLYWGPVPALALAAVKTLFRLKTVVGDDVVVFALTTLQLAAGTWVVGRAARTHFRCPPVALQVMAVLVMGFANPTPYNLARPAVYEAAIIGAHGFLLLGLAFAFESAARQSPRRWLVGAGVGWALALGCRVSIAPAIALLALLVAILAAGGPPPGRLRRAAAVLLPIAVPVALGSAGLLAYNRLRFESWLEFGRRFQLTWIEAPVALRFIPANLYSILLRAPALSCRFPYAFALPDLGARAFPAWVHLPAGYFVYEQVAGVLVILPWSWAAPFGWAVVVADWRRERRLTPRSWAVLMATVAAAVTMAPALMLASATNRYLGDGVGGIVLSGTFGVWVAHAAVKADAAKGRAVLAGAAALAALSVAAGLALGVYGQYGHFPANNPPLYDKLVHGLSVCGPVVPPPPN